MINHATINDCTKRVALFRKKNMVLSLELKMIQNKQRVERSSFPPSHRVSHTFDLLVGDERISDTEISICWAVPIVYLS